MIDTMSEWWEMNVDRKSPHGETEPLMEMVPAQNLEYNILFF